MRNIEVKKYDYIDALRGFAIIGVVLVHTSQWITPASSLLFMIVSEGGMGVQLFYVASALTLFLSMSARKETEEKPLMSFFIRRFFRIAPAFYCAIALYTAYYGMASSHWAPNGMEWWYISLTAFFMHGWYPETINSVVPGGWSIAVEMTFYIFVPYLFLKLKSIKLTLGALFLSILCSRILSFFVVDTLVAYYPESQYYLVYSFENMWFFSQLPVFVSGILLYHIIKKYPRSDKLTSLCLLAVSIFMFAAFLTAQTFVNLLPKHVLYGFSFVLFSLSLHYYPWQVLVNRFVVLIGRLSFSIYLTHFIVLDSIRIKYPDGFIANGDLGFLVAFVVVLLFSICLSYVTNAIIEKPGVKLGKYFVKKIQAHYVFG